MQRVEGSGGDGGVEAFARFANGDVVGLQSKYFRELKEKQWKQVEASIQQASKSHPSLKRYVVAVPLDRTPAALKRWAEIERQWKPTLNLVWWGHSELLHLLSQAQHHGRLRYWFGATQFEATWLARQNATAISDLDTRYTPARHVRTESENLLDGVAVADPFVRHYARHIHGLTEAAKDLIRGLGRDLPREIATAAKQLEDEIAALLPILGRGTDVPQMAEVQKVCTAWKEAAGKLWELLDQAASTLPRGEADPFNPSGEKFSYEHRHPIRAQNGRDAADSLRNGGLSERGGR